MSFKLMICGSRSLTDESLIFSKLNEFLTKEELILISGGAKGVDEIGEKWAKQNNIPIQQFKPEWKKYGRAAGIIRNKQMIEISDYVLIFWDGKSKGTKSDIDYCKKLDKAYFLKLCESLSINSKKGRSEE